MNWLSGLVYTIYIKANPQKGANVIDTTNSVNKLLIYKIIIKKKKKKSLENVTLRR